MNEVGAYEFGEFRIDSEKQQLTRHGELINIRPRLFDLLLFLVKNRGEVVTREEIIDRVWTDSFIEDANITQSIHFLRRIIDDPRQSESWIVTIPKRGYLFVAEEKDEYPDPLPDLSGDGNEPPTEVHPSAEFGQLPLYWRRTGVKIGLAFLLLTISFLIGSYIIFRSSIRSLTILSHYQIPSQQLDPEFSPDGKFLAFSSQGDRGGNEDIYLKSVDQDQRIRLTTHPDADRNPVWSPDGERIAFLRWSPDDRQTARVIITDDKGGDEREVSRSRGALGWMPQGDQLIVNDLAEKGTAATVLYLVTLDGQKRQQLTSSTSVQTVDTMPRAAIYRQDIAFLRTTGGPRGEIHLLDLPSGRVTQVTREEGAISFFRWGIREGGFYLVSNRTGEPRLWHFGLPGLVSTIYGHPGSARLVDQMPYQLNQFSILPEPPLLAYAHQIRDQQVRLIDLAGQKVISRRQGCLLPGAGTDEPPQFSPRGDQVAYLSTLGGREGIWKADVDCNNQVRLIDVGPGRIGHLRWSPDGLHLVYEGQVGDQTEIWTVGSDGSTPRRLTNSEIDEKDPSWSRDGQSIFYVALVDGQETIRRLPAAGGESVLVVSAGGREPVQSADGQRLYFVRNGGLFAGALTAPDPPLLADGSLVRLGKELKIGRHSQLGPTAVTIPADTADAAMALDQLDLSTGRIERVVQLDAATASAATGIAISPAKRYLSVVFDQGSIGELTTVEGWRLKPFSEYMIDRFYLEGVLYPQRWWRMMRDKYKD